MSPTIRVVIPYFGTWPEWSPLFFETVRRNQGVDFLVITDCDPEAGATPNVAVRSMSFADYVRSVGETLGVAFDPVAPYKLCDLKALLGDLHRADLEGYDFYGFCDVDVLFGDIRAFITDDLLASYDVISTHADRISGHLALFRNSERNRRMYRRVYDWRRCLLEPENVVMDEFGLAHAYLMTSFDKAREKFGWKIDNPVSRRMSRRRRRGMYLVEQYTTPFVSNPWIDGSRHSAQPDEWFYRDGRITNSRDTREFIYLHLMNFKSSRYRYDGTPAPWEGLAEICRATPSDMVAGIRISRSGIDPLP